MIPELTVRELADKLKSPNPPLMIDVREPWEYEYAHIEGAQLKPLGDITAWAKELDQGAEIVCQCHTGNRSLHAARFLQGLGFKNVANLKGGIEAWSEQIELQRATLLNCSPFFEIPCNRLRLRELKETRE